MLAESTLIDLARTAESLRLERKASCPNTGELRKTLCAFANSTPGGEFSVLLIGITDAGEIRGVPIEQLDSIQKTVRDAASECYPPIPVIPQVFTIEGVSVLAVVVGFSAKRPHFTGAAYQRVGSSSQKASEEAHQQFIAERSEIGRVLSRHVGTTVSATWEKHGTAGRPRINERDYTIEQCTPFWILLTDPHDRRTFAVPLGSIALSFDLPNRRLLLRIAEPYPHAAVSLADVNQGLMKVVANLGLPPH